MSDVQLVIFKLNHEVCGANISQVHEIIRYQEVSKIPELPAFVEGVVNLRGKVIPVIDLNKKFSLGARETDKKTKIIVTEIESQYIGFRVNDVNEIMQIPEQDIDNSVQLMQSMGVRNYMAGIAKNDEQLIAIIDLHKVLQYQEMEQIKNTQ